eukprot:TRINITY_DN11599_c0_g1_i1.p1 TRINITY_DN11599_c0_g1~~TRINITY_DN11599_c0_g1_i1.p1  ORF type:complete len:285 (+),score=26.48 TRINITY_DN11599_c0_g1_i1:92-856(+)
MSGAAAVLTLSLGGSPRPGQTCALEHPFPSCPVNGTVSCLAKLNSTDRDLEYALSVICSPIYPGGSSYEPITRYHHCNWAFNSFWHKYAQTGDGRSDLGQRLARAARTLQVLGTCSLDLYDLADSHNGAKRDLPPGVADTFCCSDCLRCTIDQNSSDGDAYRTIDWLCRQMPVTCMDFGRLVNPRLSLVAKANWLVNKWWSPVRCNLGASACNFDGIGVTGRIAPGNSTPCSDISLTSLAQHSQQLAVGSNGCP